MATITKRNNTYKITVSAGYDIDGKQIRKHKTWKPSPGMTAKQIEKEVNRQAVLFEEQVQNGTYLDGSIRFSEFAEQWFESYAKEQLRAKTIEQYTALIERVNQCIGHIRLDRLQPQHLINFYKELAKDGIRHDTKYRCLIDLKEYRKAKKLKKKDLVNLSGVAESTFDAAENKKNVSKETAAKIAEAIEKPLDEVFEPIGKTNLSDKTIQLHHTLISSILSTAVEWQIITSNPCQRVKRPKVRQNTPSYLDEEETRRMLELLENEGIQQKTMIYLLVFLGLRRGELVGLKWSDIDFENNTVNIDRTVIYSPGKGVYESDTKTNTSHQTVKVTAFITQLLKQYKAWQAAERLKVGDKWKDNGFVFTRTTGEPLRPDYVTSWFKDFARKNNLPEDIHIHSLRHTNASLQIAAGTPLTTVAHRLGHANASTTTKIYAHFIKSSDEVAAEAIQDMLMPVKKAT